MSVGFGVKRLGIWFTSECRGLLFCIPSKQTTFHLDRIHFGFGDTFY